jgi:hypothetical protein
MTLHGPFKLIEKGRTFIIFKELLKEELHCSKICQPS